MEDAGIGPFDTTRWLPAWRPAGCDDKGNKDEVDEDTNIVCGDCTAEGEAVDQLTALVAMIVGGDENVMGAKVMDEVTEFTEETSDDEGIMTAASETTELPLCWPASPAPVTPTQFTEVPSPPLTTFVSNWAESITAVTANWALAESSVKREVGWDEKECWRSLPEPPPWLLAATVEGESWLRSSASCSLCISISCWRWQLKLSRLNSRDEGEDDLELNAERCKDDRASSRNESSSGGGVWGL